MNGVLWIVGYPVFAFIGAMACYLVIRSRAAREVNAFFEEFADAKADQARLLTEKLEAVKKSDGYGDALKAIMDVVVWSDDPAAVRAIAHQALETGGYPGRLNAVLDALEHAENELHRAHEEYAHLGEWAASK